MKIFSILCLLCIPAAVIIYFNNIRVSATSRPILTPAVTHTASSPTPIATPTPLPTVTIGLVGDLGLGRHITSTARVKNNFNWSFEKISPWLDQNNITFANLESPVIKDCPPGLTGTFTFCGDPRFVPYLKQYKFALTLANNHILNYGPDGLTQTKQYLSSADIPFVYSFTPDSEFKIITINGITFGQLGYDFVTYPKFNKQIIIDNVKKYDSQVDWLIVSLHWGNEYLPTAEKWRVDFAHQLVDAGTDIIHGHHPHVWQPDEVYQGKPIFYSLGNFVFDQSWSRETSSTQIVRLTLSKNQILTSTKFPVDIKYNSQPVITAN